MQSKQFDNLMDGKKSFWAELGKGVPDMKSPEPIKKQIKKHLAKNEIEVPEEIVKEVKAFCSMLVKIKPKIPMYEIRRRVKVKFNIEVV